MRTIPIDWLEIEINETQSTIPSGKSGRMEMLRKTIRTLQPSSNLSFVWAGPQTKIYEAAKQIHARVRTCKENNCGYRVWRIQ